MKYLLQKTASRLLLVSLILLGIVLGLGLLNPASAAAAIRQLEEAPGQVVYQSRQTLKDQYENGWQVIAFKRIRSDGTTSLALRLVGFPGVAAIDRSQPLTLANSLGKTLTARDDSGKIFTNETTPEPNVGQYDLQPLLSQLQTEIPLQLSLPTTDGKVIQITVPPSLLEEWQTIAASQAG